MTTATPAVSAAAPTDQHGAKAHSDGGWDSNEKGYVPVQTRSARFTSTNPADFAAVTGLEAEWKLSPVALIRPLIDGELDGSPYAYLSTESEGVAVEWIDRTDSRIGSVGSPEEKASANAWASFDKALSVTLTGESSAEVTISRSGLGSTARAGHTVIVAKANSVGTIVLQNSGGALLSENVEVIVEDGARLTLISVQEWDDEGIHLSSQFARVGRDAYLKHIVVSLGGKVVRVNPSVALAGEGADGELFGVYFADAGQHLEQRVYMFHEGAHTKGRVNYKGALNGVGAHTVWVGDVLIGPAASGTDSYEQNRNLVLSEGTRADSIPNLEIQTGDIAGAGHASATGRFDDEHLFYLQARGIPEKEARRLVVLGFLTEVIQKIGKGDLETRLLQAVEAELGRIA
ncbi:Fe-S cluster assembly protein SufD [Glaciihabitans sp. dw_435]|uniref:Fe-S cluster assembly protein SufD n=1 Tax=Glaciihabitans sp. dw_435 TaxID=2720081 RepID=UPI001BD61DE8|nr:Fe-S cluster assembly protein SufD [Glaciihabitans sp. dw_435]